MRHSKKLGESFVRVINNQNHHLVIKPDPEQGRTAKPGQDYSVACISRGADPAPTLSFMIGGQNASEMYNVQVENLPSANGKDVGIIADIRGTPDSLFRNNYLTIECLARFDDFLFDKKEITLDRTEPEGIAAPTAGGRRQGSWGDENDYNNDYSQYNK